jgi:site-specific recombinase XerD
MFKRGGVWRINLRWNGKRIQKSLGTISKKLAEQIEAKIKAQLAEENYFDKPIGANKTVAQMMERFIVEHAPKVSSNMQLSYKTSLKNLLPYFGEMPITEVTPKKITSYKQQRRVNGVTPATINRELACLSKAFNIAFKEWEWVKENPLLKVSKEKENNERDRCLMADEEPKLLLCSPAWLRDIVVYALNTGKRKNEILSLEWPEVDFSRRVVTVINSKNGAKRTIPLNHTVCELLERTWKARNQNIRYVFPSYAGSKISAGNLNRAFKKSLKKAGIKDFRFHDLRHTFATRLVQSGVDIYRLQKLLGHKTLRMVCRYAHHNSESLRDSVEVLDGCKLATIVGKTKFYDG